MAESTRHERALNPATGLPITWFDPSLTYLANLAQAVVPDADIGLMTGGIYIWPPSGRPDACTIDGECLNTGLEHAIRAVQPYTLAAISGGATRLPQGRDLAMASHNLFNLIPDTSSARGVECFAQRPGPELHFAVVFAGLKPDDNLVLAQKLSLHIIERLSAPANAPAQ